VLPGIIGSLQAMEALKLLLGAGNTLAGRLLLFDAMECRFREIELRRNPECPVCGDSPTQTGLIDYDLFCGLTVQPGQGGVEANGESVPQLTPEEAARRLEWPEGDRPFLVDVREEGEWAVGNLSAFGARLIPLGSLEARADELPRDREILVYCRMGSRGDEAGRRLRALGFSRVTNLAGGLLRWAELIDPEIPVP
jgi:adenylyltransferase/sulfurtransferase